MKGALLAIASMQCLIVIYAVATTAAALLARVPVTEIGIGFGPTLKRWRAGGVSILWKALPLGSYVRWDQGPVLDAVADEHADRGGRGPRDGVGGELGVAVHTALHLSAPVGTLGCAMLATGPAPGAAVFAASFSTAFLGALHPEAVGAPIIRAWWVLLETEGWIRATGMLGAAMAGCNLLPLPPLGGGQILWRLFAGGRPLPDRLMMASFAVYLLLVGGWTAALWTAVS